MSHPSDRLIDAETWWCWVGADIAILAMYVSELMDNLPKADSELNCRRGMFN